MVNRLNPMVAIASGSGKQSRRWAKQLLLAGVEFNLVESMSGECSEIWVDEDAAAEARSVLIHVVIPGRALIW